MDFLFKIKVRYKNEEKQSFEWISLSNRERKKREKKNGNSLHAFIVYSKYILSLLNAVLSKQLFFAFSSILYQFTRLLENNMVQVLLFLTFDNFNEF